MADTSLLNFSSGARRLLQDSQFRVLNGRKSFFAPVIGPDYTFFRFDKACMVPIDAQSRAALEEMDCAISDLPFEQVDWTEGQVLVLDNWRILHGRSSPAGSGGGRVLERVLVQ
ncbi:TauD/TfdA family dioxygenase [Woeseia oceani]|uniref:TauD/TfdA family dioxygenase n=1 Tax=Woeseia oceani TaxID=1548547 RepID=UPI0018D276C6|nr:TauD/TfdA family dioxygenase [Woeseia oceani]